MSAHCDDITALCSSDLKLSGRAKTTNLVADLIKDENQRISQLTTHAKNGNKSSQASEEPTEKTVFVATE